jgi:hypothetical protein
MTLVICVGVGAKRSHCHVVNEERDGKWRQRRVKWGQKRDYALEDARPGCSRRIGASLDLTFAHSTAPQLLYRSAPID